MNQLPSCAEKLDGKVAGIFGRLLGTTVILVHLHDVWLLDLASARPELRIRCVFRCGRAAGVCMCC